MDDGIKKLAKAVAAMKSETEKWDESAKVALANGHLPSTPRPVQPAATPAPPLDMAEFSAFEFGYRCCEKGMNLQAAYAEYQKVTGGK